MIELSHVLHVHEKLLEEFGGGKGIRDLGLLEAAISRPFLTFEKIDLYPNAEEKAAAIIESIVKNHPFIDGNKRTGYVMMRLMLLSYQKDIDTSESEKYKFVIKIASSEIEFEDIVSWITSKVKNNF
jgi:death on curing protein